MVALILAAQTETNAKSHKARYIDGKIILSRRENNVLQFKEEEAFSDGRSRSNTIKQ